MLFEERDLESLSERECLQAILEQLKSIGKLLEISVNKEG